ncbi:NADH-quinone oxidoreductase subunit M [Nocardioides marmorisolisilvae]|uniref:NADH-quinone oxidoreductase subunit M n=1 Tax=Nocardioides marmorisolisilvae TaxID=1542737 RepID=A0A3N0DZY4_9ACTN|nr:NADH-quinone oxidoreductase subunit M [Nocardioides marmorisolisilvae]RNL81152.1 NADH-quinone oxidoreductase subunit M [Nocardioides marmorisolisilvae]
MSDFPWLTVMLVVPFLGAVAMPLLPKSLSVENAKRFALSVAGVELVLGVIIGLKFHNDGGVQFTENHEWIKAFGAHYALGVEGLGLSLVLLTVILTPIVMLAGWNDGDEGRWSPRAFFAWMLALEALAVGVFSATDVFLFYVFFEATLIPIYFLVGGYGGPKRAKAAVKFLLYNLFGGLVMLAAVIGLYVESAKAGHPSYLISDLAKLDISTDVGRWLFLGFMVAFVVKAPLFPVHTWLPDTSESATPGTSVLLVSILDKIGSFGMVRFCLSLFPEASHWATPAVVVLAIISIIYGALMAIGEDDILRLIAYTSVSHFGFIVLGIFVLNSQGLQGSNLYMFNHGLSTAALFLVAGYLIKRHGSASIRDYAGVEKAAPLLAGFLLISGLAVLSLPGLSPFVSEFLVIVGAFVYSPWAGAFAVTGIVLAAIYVLLMYQRTMTGPLREDNATITDLNLREKVAVVPVLLLMIILGLFPKPLADMLNPSTDHSLSQVGAKDPAPTVSDSAEGSAQ